MEVRGKLEKPTWHQGCDSIPTNAGPGWESFSLRGNLQTRLGCRVMCPTLDPGRFFVPRGNTSKTYTLLSLLAVRGLPLAMAMIAVLLSGCGGGAKQKAKSASPPPKQLVAALPTRTDAKPAPRADGAKAAAAATRFADTHHLPKGSRRDCSGFVLAAYEAAGDPLTIPERYRKGGSVSVMLHEWMRGSDRSFKNGAPKPGDLVFFRDTTGPLKNRITHIGIVERVAADGTVTFLHHMSGKMRRDKMSLTNRTDPEKNGYLRRKKKRTDPALAGELFVAYARP